MLKVGNICFDGTKIEANASRHSVLSHRHIEKLEAQLKAEVQKLLALAEQADQAEIPDGVSLPEELKRREDRPAAMAAAKAKIAARAEERYQREKAEYDEKIAGRAAKEEATGKKLGGKPPKAPEPGARDSDQINLTDEESRIMPMAGGGFELAYNAQAAADAGYGCAKNILACAAAGIEPLIAVARDAHHPGWRARHREPSPLPDDATPMQAMSHRLKTREERARYALRKQTIEPVFGIIKSVMGFLRFSLRGFKKVTGQWTLVCLAWNLKRMAVLRPQ